MAKYIYIYGKVYGIYLLSSLLMTCFDGSMCVQVHWVQCDKCELWYHLYCIGLKPHNIKEDEDFCCR